MNIAHLNNIQTLFDQSVKSSKAAGLNCLIYKDDKEAGYFQAGYSSIENKTAFERNTICRLFSMTKPVTSVAAMILVEEGKLDLGEELGFYLPEFWNVKVCRGQGKDCKVEKSGRNILIQDLMNMTSGYTYGAYWDGACKGEWDTSDLILELNEDVLSHSFKITTRKVAERLSQIPLSFEPGTNYSYGLSADIMGAVIEKVSGMKFSEFLKKRIFEPLGMNDTAFYVPAEKQNRFASSYDRKDVPGGGFSLERFTGANLGISPDMTQPPSFESGGAGLCSTIDDYMKFASMLCNKGILNGKRILQEKTVEYMASAKLNPLLQQCFDRNMEHFAGYTYCNFLRIALNPGSCRAITEKGEFGWDGWLGPYVSVDIKNHLVIVMMMQRCGAGTNDITRKMKNIVYTAL